MQTVLKKIEALLEPPIRSEGCELVACEWSSDAGRKILRVLIDKEGGVKVEDCESISRLIDPLLEVEGEIQERYSLEVSSPGLNRPLRKEKDFERFAGETIFIKTTTPLNNRSNFKGLLKGVTDRKVLVEIDRDLFEIPLEIILKANLEFDFDKLLKNKKK